METNATSVSTPPRQVLRDYQERAIESLRTGIRRGRRRLLLVSPTGSGKTTIAAAMIDAAVAKGKRIVFLAHRKELIDQCSTRLAGLGVQHGIIMADHPARRPWLPVHVASVQTLVRRETETPPDLVFVDECHRARAKTYESILSRWPGAVVIGLTATPVRSDGKGLGSLFEEMVLCPSVAELTTMGHLVPTRVFAPNKPDLAGVKLTGGDYNQQQLSMIMDKPTITGDIVAHWLRLGEQRITVLFAVDVEHSKHLRDQFLAAGVPSAHLDGETPVREREGLLADLAAGRIRVLCSVGVLTEGWDCPVASCAVLVRPTKSMGLYLQMAGRILRPAPDKSDALILDHAGCTLAHGLVDEEREWSLDGDTRRKRDGAIDTALSIRVCPKCYAVYGPTVRECACGYVFAVRRERPRHEPGDLQEVTGKRKGYLLMGEDRRREMYMRWAAEVHEKGYKPVYPLARYRAMFGVPPPMEWQLEASLRVKRIAQEGEWRAAR